MMAERTRDLPDRFVSPKHDDRPAERGRRGYRGGDGPQLLPAGWSGITTGQGEAGTAQAVSHDTPISRDGQAVTITFTDFCVDVVPAFNRQGGGYLIPDSIQRRWIETDPKRHVEIWAEANKKHGYKLVPIIKMVKARNKMQTPSFSLSLWRPDAPDAHQRHNLRLPLGHPLLLRQGSIPDSVGSLRSSRVWRQRRLVPGPLRKGQSSRGPSGDCLPAGGGG